MGGIVTAADYLVIALSVFYIYNDIRRLLWSSRSVYFLVFFMFYVLPIFFDYMVGFQDHYHWGFAVASNDPVSRIIYDITILLVMHTLVFYKNNMPDETFQENLRDSSAAKGFIEKYNKMFVFFMVFPTIATLFFMRIPGMLYTFQWREFEVYDAGGSYSTIERFTYFGIICSILLLFDQRKKFFDFSRLIALIFLYINVCIQGKRAILFFAIIAIMIVVVFQFISLKVQKKHTFWYTFIFSLLASFGAIYMIASSVEVKIGRGYSETAQDMLYTSTRIDFFREDRVKMAIYSELKPEKIKILDYKGQSLITNVVNIVPFNYISEPLELSQGTYQVHFSMAMLKQAYNHRDPKANMNYMTCTMFAELISNFGIMLGTFLFIVLTLWFVRLTDKYPSPYNILIIVSYILLNLFDFTYIVVFIELTWLLCFLYNNNLKKIKKRLK